MSRFLALIVLLAPIALAEESWTQFGGAERDFELPARELSRSWGESGPKTLWERPLGGGFASILSHDGRLYTAYRDGDDEILIAMDAKSGETIWEHRYLAPIPKTPALSTEYGYGPNSTPLLVDGKLVALGFTGQVVCVDAANGELRWATHLGKTQNVAIPYFGHATSPLAVGENVVVVAGGLFAFNLDSGELAWKNREHKESYGSPILLGEQIVTPVTGHLAAFDAKTGETLWAVEHRNQWGTLLNTPVVDDQGRIFTSASQVGALLVDPKKPDGAVWVNKKTAINHNNVVRRGNHIFASSGDTASFLVATSVEDGKQLWKERGFAQANLLRVGDTFLLLDFDGELAMLEFDDKGMTIVAQASINDQPTWTPPTLIDDTLYFRDEARIVALDLSAD